MTVMLLQHVPQHAVKSPKSPTAPAVAAKLDEAEAALRAPRTFSQQRQGVPERRSTIHNPQRMTNLSCSDQKTMRYYRLWIYTCNAVLWVSVVGFSAVAGRIVVLDQRRALVPGLTLYHPSFLYAYVALATQSGILQIIGCLGAIRLNERLLNIYWLLILCLLLGDALLGIVWVFKFEQICQELRPSLRHRLSQDYGKDPDFTALWDRVQEEYNCCGVSPLNLGTTAASATSGPIVTVVVTNTASSEEVISDTAHGDAHESDHSTIAGTASQNASTGISAAATVVVVPGVNASCPGVPASAAGSHVQVGCEERLLYWLRQSADVLFVLGYCVIAFLKLCFLGILRYEIKEMIQKIKVLQGELRPPQLLMDGSTDLGIGVGILAATAGTGVTSNDPVTQPLLNHVSGTTTDCTDNDTGPPSGQVAGVGSHVAVSTVSAHHRHFALLNNDGNDSDTNSHCALIVPERESQSGGKSSSGGGNAGDGSNGNNNYELHELQQLNRLLYRHQSMI